MKLLREVCSLPTAPFAEARVAQWVESFVASRKGLELSRDRWGNLLIHLDAPMRRGRWVFVAHMDHPGLVARQMTDRQTLYAHFRGGVLADYLPGTKVLFFASDGRKIKGRITRVLQYDPDRPALPASVAVRITQAVPPGTPGMFDLGEARVRGKRLLSRAIDDLGGVAAALEMLDRLRAPKRPRSTSDRDPKPSARNRNVAVLLTRAEEDGFIGAIAAARDEKLIRKSDRIISIECSAQQPYAPMGKGVVIRAGDRTSVFDSALTYFLGQQAEQLARTDKSFAFQRALMPGGTCEATVFDLFGYTAAAACIPLGNYHNMDKLAKRIAPEYINLSDWKNMVKLFVAVVKNGHEFNPSNPQLRHRIEARFRKHAKLLKMRTEG